MKISKDVDFLGRNICNFSLKLGVLDLEIFGCVWLNKNCVAQNFIEWAEKLSDHFKKVAKPFLYLFNNPLKQF